jgi:hypothetical protein
MRARVVCTGLIIAATGSFWFTPPYSVSRALSERMRRGPGTTVDFAEIAPFPWERVYVFGPYTSHERIQETLGFDWPGVRRTTVQGGKSVNLVVFVRDGTVVHWFEHPRREGLEGLVDPRGYAREEARFPVCGQDQRLALDRPKSR